MFVLANFAVALPFSIIASAATTPSTPGVANCTTTREFVTTLEFLRAKKDFEIPEAEARKIASRVANGCTGSAQRFIRVSSLLANAGLGSKDAIEQGLDFSRRADAEVEAFGAVFRRAFLENYLDLDLRSSLQMARALSREFDGDLTHVRQDFEQLVDFCVRDKSLNLPKPECGAFAARITRKGQIWNGAVARPFIDAYAYLTSDKGPHLITGNALSLAEDLVSTGPGGIENFTQAYRYAASAKGLAMSDTDALTFAKEMAQRKATVPDTKQKPSSK